MFGFFLSLVFFVRTSYPPVGTGRSLSSQTLNNPSLKHSTHFVLDNVTAATIQIIDWTNPKNLALKVIHSSQLSRLNSGTRATQSHSLQPIGGSHLFRVWCIGGFCNVFSSSSSSHSMQNLLALAITVQTQTNYVTSPP